MLFINDSSSGNNMGATVDVVSTHKRFPLMDVTGCTNVVDTILQNKAAWAWTLPQASDTSNQNSSHI